MKSLYIHFPYCIHLCNYCDFYKHKFEGQEQIDSLLDLLRDQIDELNKLNDYTQVKDMPLETFYIGGGTPSLWKPNFMKSFLEVLKAKGYSINEQTEFTIEVDPGTFSEEDLIGWKKLGVNRLSVGVQAYSDRFLKILDRRHSKNQITESLNMIAEHFENFSLDLMIGIPHSSERNLLHEIDELAEFNPMHFSVYILGVRKNYPLLKEMPEEELIARDYIAVSDRLRELGFSHYEVSNYAKNGFNSAHNEKYWNFETVGAVGPNATGTIVRNESLYRYQWKSLSAGYIEEVIEGTSHLLEKIFLSLRMSRGFDLSSFFPSENLNNLEQIIDKWREKGYVSSNSKATELCVTPRGFLFNDSMVQDLMPLMGD